MNHEALKEEAVRIIESGLPENDYIEYRSSLKHADEISRTICAFANNYMNYPQRYLFIGIKTKEMEDGKSVPKRPISGLGKEQIALIEDEINELIEKTIYPVPNFDMVSAKVDGEHFIVLDISACNDGYYEVKEKIKKGNGGYSDTKAYVRIDGQTRVATFQELFQLLKKFRKFYFTENVSETGTIKDLDMFLVRDYLGKIGEKVSNLDKSDKSICKRLNLLDEADPSKTKVKNLALLMFSENPEKFIPGGYILAVRDSGGKNPLIEEHRFEGPIQKQLKDVMSFLDNRIISSYTLRPDDKSEHRILWNFPREALYELIVNALVHKNYMKPEPIQIHIYKDSINISNYNSPLPPVNPKDLNEKTDFPNRQYENKSICSMFKALGLIEYSGSGVKKAKEAMKENGSDNIEYDEFQGGAEITSVSVPINKEFYKLVKKAGDRYINSDLEIKKANLNTPNNKGDSKKDIENSIPDIEPNNYLDISKYTLDKFKEFRSKFHEDVWGRTEVMHILNCSPATGTKYIKRWVKSGLVKPVKGLGKGKFRF